MGLVKLLILTAAISLTYGVVFENSDGNKRIVGGKPVDILQVPFQVLLYYDYKFVCSGVILNDMWVLTTASCLNGLIDTKITIVSNETSNNCFYPPACVPKQTNVSRVIRHLNFNEMTYDSDIALIRAKEGIVLEVDNSPLAAELPEEDEIAAPGSRTTVAGLGIQKETDKVTTHPMSQVVVPVISQSTCNIAYARYGGLTPSMLCAGTMEGGRDPCIGDSGSPLVLGHKLLGLASWGHGCGRVGYPGVYTRIPYFVKWIKKNMA